MNITKTIEVNKLHKPTQTAQYVVEILDLNEWKQIASFTELSKANGFIEGYSHGAKHFDTPEEQTAIIVQGNWP